MEDRRVLLVAALSTLVFLGALRPFVSSVYFLNLEALELNETAAYTLLLLSPLLLALPPLARRPRPVLIGAAGVMAVGGVLTGLAGLAGTATTMIALAGVTSAAYLIILPLLLHLGRAVPVAIGTAAALALDTARLTAGHSIEPLPRDLHLVFLMLVGIALVALVVRPRGERPVERPKVSRPAALLAGLGVGAWLFLQTNLWASAHHVARWNETPVLLVAAGAVIGLVLGAWLVLRHGSRTIPWRALAFAQPLPLLLLVDHTLIHSPVLPMTLLLAQTVLVIDLALLLRVLARARLEHAALGLTAGAALLLALLFATVFALTFAYVPYGPVWEGRAWLFLLVGVAVVTGAVLTVLTRHRLGASDGFPRTVTERRIVAVLLVLPLVVGAVPVAVPDAPAPPPDGRELRVLSFNVHQGFNNDGVLDAELYVRIVEALDPDLVSLQESDTTRITSGNLDIVDVIASRLGYHAYHGPPTRAQSFGIAVLSRYPIEQTLLQPLPSEADNRNLVGAQVTIDGISTWLLAVHMGLDQPDRQAQIDEILARADRLGGPLILAGDFNSCPQGLCPAYDGPADTVYQQVTATYQDTWTAAGHERDDPAGHTYHATAPEKRIDHIYTSGDFTVQEARVDRSPEARAASDHLPVLAELTLNP